MSTTKPKSVINTYIKSHTYIYTDNYPHSHVRLSWEDVQKFVPEASVMWDVQGGPEWQGDRQGPRLFYYRDAEQLTAYVGDPSDGGDFGWADYFIKNGKWEFNY
jgi:hypothetical protein